MRHLTRLLLVGLAGTLLSPRKGEPAAARQAVPRHPAALAVQGGHWLYVANERSGTISTIDLAAKRVAGETAVGRRLADLIALPNGRLAALDSDAAQLVLLRCSGATLAITARLSVPPYPVRLRATADGRSCLISCLWPRCVAVVEFGGEAPRLARAISMPFAPRELLLLSGGRKTLVADGFGGRLALVDMATGELESVRSLTGHNIRGLALAPDGKSVLLSHQILDPRVSTSVDDIHWGNLLTNNVRSLDVTAVLNPNVDLLRGSHLRHLGEVHQGAADPAGLVLAADGTMAVALAGVNEVLIGRPREDSWQREPVGARPTAVQLAPDGTTALVANTLGDSITVVNLKLRKVTAEIPLGTSAQESAVSRGERLFFSARLAHDGWLSCHSCHPDGHTTGLLNDNLTDGSYGTPKRIPSLGGVRDTAPYAWSGSVPDLEAQVRKSIDTTMRGTKPSDQDVEDLAAYLRTLPPMPGPDHFDNLAKRGKDIFHARRCDACHLPPTYTSRGSYDVGLADEAGLRRFNPPSLRGVGQSGPYFHDGRARTLEEVFDRYHHPAEPALAREEVKALVAFLRTL